MRTILKIAKSELQKLFYSPVAWMVIVIFTFQVAASFTGTMDDIMNTLLRRSGTYPDITYDLYASRFPGGLFYAIASYAYLYIPLLTMNVISRELSTGSIKLLYSSPVTNRQIVIGKYVGLVAFAGLMTGIVLVFAFFSITIIAEVDTGIVFCGVLGIFLLICAYSAIGLFVSSLTTYSIVGAIGTLAILGILGYVGTLWQDVAFARDISYWLSMSGRVDTFIQGMITSEDLLYFLIVIALFLGFTVLKLQAGRQKVNLVWNLTRYAGVFMIVSAIGYLSSRPKLKVYGDFSQTNRNTLSEGSKKVLEKLPYGLTIHTYINMFDPQAWIAVPKQYKADVARFDQYLRFKPEIRMEYTYYYKRTPEQGLELRYPGASDEQVLDSLRLLNKWNFKIVPYSSKLDGKSNLATENFHFTRVLESSNGKRTFLRIFNDQIRLPSEAEITAAMKRLTDNSQLVGFVTGHGERSIDDLRERGYKMVTQEKGFRNSLLNNGFDFRNVSLDFPVSPKIDILVIAELKSGLTKVQKAHLQKYLDQGGNMFIAAEPGKQGFMNQITDAMGVKFLTGQLVQSSTTLGPEVAIGRLTSKAKSFSHHLEEEMRYNGLLPINEGVGLEIIPNRGFKSTTLVESDAQGWNEIETTNFKDDTVSLNATTGEQQRSHPVVSALSRTIGTREQRIIVTGDADWMSNGELNMIRGDFSRPANLGMIQAAFNWLTYGELPVDMRHPQPKDNTLMITEGIWNGWAIVWKWVFPGFLLLLALVISIRRRGR